MSAKMLLAVLILAALTSGCSMAKIEAEKEAERQKAEEEAAAAKAAEEQAAAAAAEQEAAVVESVKAASDVYAPIAGRIVEVNPALAEDPGLINREPTGEGWFFRIEPKEPGAVAALLDEAAYTAFVESQA